MEFQRRIKLIVLMGLAGTFLFCFSCRAENPLSLSVSPLFFDFEIDPGAEKDGKLFVANSSDTNVQVEAEFSNFFINDAGGYIFSDSKEISNENLKLYLADDWFSLSEKSFALGRGESKTVSYKIKVPADASLGGHYGAVFFRTVCSSEENENITSTDKSHVCVSGRVGTLFLIQVGGEAVKKGNLKKINLPKLSFKDRTDFSVEIANEGNSHFWPAGQVVVKNLFGQEMSKMEIRDKVILPTMTRPFPGSLERKDLLGFYKVQGAIKDGDGNEMRFSRLAFLPPWKETLIAILAVSGLVWFFNKFKIKKIKK